MGRSEDLDTAMWDDPDFEPLTIEAKALYLWSWSNRRCGMAGLYKVSRRAIGTALNLVDERLNDALKELEEARFLFYDETWLWVRSRAKLLMPRTTQMAKSVAKDFAKVPVDHPFRTRFLEEIEGLVWLQRGLEADNAVTRDTPATNAATINRPSSDGHPTISSLAQIQDIRDGHPTIRGPSPDGPEQEQEQERSTTTSQGVGRKSPARSKTVDPDSLPADFPEPLAPVADQVLAKLRQLQSERGGNEPTRRGVGLAIAAWPNHDHLRVVGELEHWATAGGGQARSIKDWTTTLRNFLEKSAPGAPTRLRSLTGTDVMRTSREAEEAVDRRVLAESESAA
jgi:hypothetical protein